MFLDFDVSHGIQSFKDGTRLVLHLALRKNDKTYVCYRKVGPTWGAQVRLLRVRVRTQDQSLFIL